MHRSCKAAVVPERGFGTHQGLLPTPGLEVLASNLWGADSIKLLLALRNPL